MDPRFESEYEKDYKRARDWVASGNLPKDYVRRLVKDFSEYLGERPPNWADPTPWTAGGQPSGYTEGGGCTPSAEPDLSTCDQGTGADPLRGPMPEPPAGRVGERRPDRSNLHRLPPELQDDPAYQTAFRSGQDRYAVDLTHQRSPHHGGPTRRVECGQSWYLDLTRNICGKKAQTIIGGGGGPSVNAEEMGWKKSNRNRSWNSNAVCGDCRGTW